MSEIINSHIANKFPIVTCAYNITQFTVFGQTNEFHQPGSGNENNTGQQIVTDIMLVR